jgi:mannose-6-phosphate isomerase-like protein (cupin superfamily)
MTDRVRIVPPGLSGPGIYGPANSAMSKGDREEAVKSVSNREDVKPIVAADGAIVRELASPRNSPLTRHSLAEIRHPPGTSSLEHYHTEAEEVYYIVGGRGTVRIDGVAHDLGAGDVVAIAPGQRHKVWPRGEAELVMLVTCVPAYSVDEVIFTE